MSKQGTAVILPNGERRLDYIQREFYEKEVSRGDITRAINKMYEDAGDPTRIPYQIVFSGTKLNAEDFQKAQKERADRVAKREAAKAEKEKEKEEKAAAKKAKAEAAKKAA